MSDIRLLIVDDNDVVRLALSMFLRRSEGITLVGQASNGIEAVQKCSDLHPDVVLMDLVMPEMNGITATRLIRQANPDIKVIGLTSTGGTDREQLQALLDAGASGYLFKSASTREIQQAIISTHSSSETEEIC